MDLSLSFEKYLQLPKEEALNGYSDDKNLKSLSYILIIVSGIFMITTIVYIVEFGFLSLPSIFSLLAFLAPLSLRIFFGNIFSKKNVRRAVYIFLISFMAAFMLVHFLADISKPVKESVNITKEIPPKPLETKIQKESNDDEPDITIDTKVNSDSYTDIIFLFCLSILFFRLTRNELIQLFLIGFGLTFAVQFIFKGNISSGNIPNLVFSVIFCSIALLSESKYRKKFYKQYDYLQTRHSDSIRIKQELNYAREMQLSMLPERNAKIDDIEISAVSIPATEVGGDYFDYFKISENKTGIFICDVSGHGVVSALLLSGLRSCMHLILEDTSNPREVFNKLNRMIRKTQNRRMFVTAIFAVIDIKENTCSLFNAGHLPPYKISGESNELFKIKKHGLTLGAMDILEQNEGESEVIFEFKKNDKLIFYTDGLSEAMDPAKREFGFERIENYLNSNADLSSDKLLESLQKCVNEHTKNTPQKDDLTILVIGRN
ncbi:MAG TPA: PP2C family protein-serine/threonine phosphatase [Ignavibacteria bacterium]